MKANAIDATIQTLVSDYLQSQRASHQQRTALTTSLDLSHEARSALSGFLRGGQLEYLHSKADDVLGHHSRVKAEVEQARSVHHSVPPTDVVADIIQRREALRAELADLAIKDASMEQEIERLQRDLERRERALNRLIEADVKSRERRDDRDRVLSYVPRVRKTLSSFRGATIKRHVARIQYLVLESYQQLLRKTSLVTGLLIDPENFALTLFDRTGDVLPPDLLSAGERQLLGIALLWGLAKASGPSPANGDRHPAWSP